MPDTDTFDPETGEYIPADDTADDTADDDTTAEATEAAPKNGKARRSATRRAKQAISDAASRGDYKAVRAIGSTFLEVEDAKERIKEERARWKVRLDAAEATMRGAIEADDDTTAEGARRKLNSIVLAFQDVEESTAGRKAALHLLIEDRKESEARLRKQIEGARQLGLFDD